MFDWNDFWSVIWSFFWILAFVAYVMALFLVITDLFRDHKLEGRWKAVWVVFLVFVPFLTVLAYLVTRGAGMQERASEQSRQLQAAADERIRRVAHYSPSDEIAKAKALVDNGTLTLQEYEQIKSRALSHSG